MKDENGHRIDFGLSRYASRYPAANSIAREKSARAGLRGAFGFHEERLSRLTGKLVAAQAKPAHHRNHQHIINLSAKIERIRQQG